MNRTIKFRAWVPNQYLFSESTRQKYPEGRMFTGFGFRNVDAGHEEANAWCESERWEEPDWEHSTLMQFTGLLDKNGKEIYEGDLVRHTANRKVWEVVWRNFSWCYSTVNTKDSFGLNETYTFDTSHAMLQKVDVEYEVIGNIYENPELLCT